MLSTGVISPGSGGSGELHRLVGEISAQSGHYHAFSAMKLAFDRTSGADGFYRFVEVLTAEP